MANAIAHELYALTHGATREELEQRIETLLEERSDGLDTVAGRISNELDDDYRPGSESVADAACDAINIAADHKESVERALDALNEALKKHSGAVEQRNTLAEAVDAIVDDLDAAHESLKQALDRERSEAAKSFAVPLAEHERVVAEGSAESARLRAALRIARDGLVAATNALNTKRLSAKRRETAAARAVEAHERAGRRAEGND